MVQQTLVVRNKIGIHSRPAALLVDTAGKFKATISLTKGEATASTKSLIKILALKVKQDNEVTIRCEGEDEAAALGALVALIENKFGEE